MADLAGSRTHANLVQAFTQEARANRLYLYFARLADLEGQHEVAQVFRDAAQGETGHAHGHLDFLREVGEPTTGRPVGDTRQNLETAMLLEESETTQSYPEMAQVARQEGFEEIARWFESLARAEDSHAEEFRSHLGKLGKRRA